MVLTHIRVRSAEVFLQVIVLVELADVKGTVTLRISSEFRSPLYKFVHALSRFVLCRKVEWCPPEVGLSVDAPLPVVIVHDCVSGRKENKGRFGVRRLRRGEEEEEEEVRRREA